MEPREFPRRRPWAARVGRAKKLDRSGDGEHGAPEDGACLSSDFMSAEIDSSLKKASELLTQGLYQEGSDELIKIFSIEPNHREALCLLAETMHRLGQSESALALLSDAMKAGDVDAAILARMAEILESLGRMDEAADFYMFAAEQAPDDAGVLKKAAEALEFVGRHEDLKGLREWLASRPGE